MDEQQIPMIEPTAEEYGELLRVRREKFAELKAAGKDPFERTRFKKTASAAAITDDFGKYEHKKVSIAGRMVSRRIMGKASFAHILDASGTIQIYVKVDELGEAFVKGAQFGGINYGVPTDKELAVNGGFIWNKTLADKYGLVPDPAWKSYRDWIPFLQTIKENEPNVLPVLADGNWHHLNWISYIGCDVGWNATKNDPTLLFMWEDPYYTDELGAARELYLNEYIPRDAAASDAGYNTQHLQKGDFFLTTQPLKPGKGKSAELMSQLIAQGVVYDEFETYPLMANTTHCGSSMLAIAQTSKDPARAMMFINEMHTDPDVTNLMAWGIEGVHYTVTQAANPKRVTPVEGNTWTGSMNGWMLGDLFSIYLSADEPADKYDLLRAAKVGIPEHVANGYRFNPEAWLDTITAVDNAKEEFQKSLRLGAIDPKEGLAGLLSAVDAAGFRPYFEAVKADYGAWLASNK